MRPFEALTLSALVPSLLVHLVPQRKRPLCSSYLPCLPALSALIQLVLEGYRWQMIPAYGLSAALVLTAVQTFLARTWARRDPPSRRRRVLSSAGTAIGLLTLVIAAALPALFPVFRFPEPTGPHAVGTGFFYWVDEGRPDTYTPEPGDFREVSVQVWYPADPSTRGKPIRYMSKEAARALAESFDLPAPTFDHFALVRTHSRPNADAAREGAPFPAITYSTSGLMSSHIALFEELASHGYVVLCIGHPYWNPFVYGASGEVLPFDGENEAYKAWWEEENGAKDAKADITVAKTTEAQERAQRRHNALKPVAIADLRRWAEDIGFVLHEFEALNLGNGLLAGAADLERVGVMGFSKGGAAAGQFCVTDEKCMAGINLTGFMYGDIVDIDLAQPFMFVSEEELWCADCYVNDLFYKRAESSAYQMKIRGARHASFGDPCLWGGLFTGIAEGATIGGQRMTRIVNAYSLAFFDKHLKGRAAALLDGPSPDYPEVVFRSHHP